MKDSKKLLNYFTKWEGAGSTGLCLMILGLAMIWFGRFAGYVFYILSVLTILVGAAIFFYGNIGRATESDLKEIIQHRKEKGQLPNIEENRAFRGRLPKSIWELEFEGYIFREGLLFKRMKNASLISSEYSYTHMKVLNDAFYLKNTVFSLVEDSVTEQLLDIPFSSVTSITVERERKNYPVGKKQYPASTCYVVFTYNDGQRLLLPQKDDIYVDELIEKLQKHI
ncbi:MAG: hypothetical protein IJX62_10005 [Clostridia bacterium]|nr:hypothetical protein [Clostridia bacterium]